MTYADITAPADDNINQGGSQATIYFAPVADINTDSAIGTVTNPEDAYLLTTAVAMKTGKKAIPIDVVITSGTLEVEGIGEDEGMAFKLTPTFSIPGNNPKALPLYNSPNGRFVFWLPLNNGKTIQVGSVKQPAYVKPNFSGGGTSGNGSFFQFTVESYQPTLKFYEAEIPTTPAA